MNNIILSLSKFKNFTTLSDPLPVDTTWKCSLIGCVLHRKESSIKEDVYAICCNFISNERVDTPIPLLALVVYNRSTNSFHHLYENSPSYSITRSNLQLLEFRVFDWDTLTDVSDTISESCQIELLFTKNG